MKTVIKRKIKQSAIFFTVILAIYNLCTVPVNYAQTNQATKHNRDSLILAAREIMGLQKYCSLVTIDSAGNPNARTMNPFPPEDDMCVWVATNSRSKKVKEIRNNPNVSLYYSDHANAAGYVLIKGKAVLVDDHAEKIKRKRDYWDQSFPDFKYLMLIKVIPERIEVINYKHKMYNDPKTFEAPFIDLNPISK